MSIFKMSVPGVRVQGARPKDLVLDSTHTNPKINTLATPPHASNIFLNWQTTTGVNLGTTKLLYYFPHNFNYIPTVFASYNFNNGSNILNGTLPFQLGGQGIITIDADAEFINLKYYSTDASIPASAITPFTMKIRYYVMVERGKA